MISKFYNNFKKLPSNDKSMINLMWIYYFGQVIATIFITIYIYKINNDFKDIIIYNSILFTAIFFGFFGLGYLATILKWNIKNFYLFAYILFISAFLELLFFKNTNIGILIFGITYGLGLGVYRNAVHSQELKNIKEEDRNQYSSSITIGKNIIESLFPLLAAGLFYIGKIYNIDIYPLLFIFLIFIYIISIYKIKNVKDYFPKKIKKIDFLNFFNFKKYKYGHLYYINGGVILVLRLVILSIIAIYFLKNEINIGFMQGLLSIIGTLLIIHISHRRDMNNRFKYYLYFASIISLMYLIFAIFFGFKLYIIFLLGLLLITPLHRVGEHIYDLSTIDNVKVEVSDFYPGMLMREGLLYIGRFISFLILIYFYTLYSEDIVIFIKIILFLIAFLYILQIFLIYLWEKYEKQEKINS